MRVYYAHSMHLYDTEQEKRDIELLYLFRFSVLNPNNDLVKEELKQYVANYGKDNTMDYFKKLIDECDAVIFRAHIDGKIPSGVGFEINYAMEKGLPVLELPTLISNKFLSLEDTRYYLQLLGNR